MALPWMQIVQLVPSILDVSRELMRKNRGAAPAPVSAESSADHELAARIIALEDNERRQAELLGKMAEQIDVLTRAVTVLHKRAVWLAWGCAGALTLGIAAIIIAAR